MATSLGDSSFVTYLNASVIILSIFVLTYVDYKLVGFFGTLPTLFTTSLDLFYYGLVESADTFHGFSSRNVSISPAV